MRRTIVATTIGTLIILVAHGYSLSHNESVRIKTRITVAVVWLSMITAWPLVWRTVVGPYMNGSYVSIGLIWPIAILCLDIVSMRQHTYDTAQRHSKRQFMTMDANAICSLTFGIAAFLGVQRDPRISRIFLWAILGCVAFIMPAPHTDGPSLDMISFEAFQKGVLAYATGLLLSGVVLVSQSSSSLSTTTRLPFTNLGSSPSASSLLTPLSSASVPSPSVNQPSNSEPQSLSSDRSSSIVTSMPLADSEAAQRRIFDDAFIKELVSRLRVDVETGALAGRTSNFGAGAGPLRF